MLWRTEQGGDGWEEGELAQGTASPEGMIGIRLYLKEVDHDQHDMWISWDCCVICNIHFDVQPAIFSIRTTVRCDVKTAIH